MKKMSLNTKAESTRPNPVPALTRAGNKLQRSKSVGLTSGAKDTLELEADRIAREISAESVVADRKVVQSKSALDRGTTADASMDSSTWTSKPTACASVHRG